MNDALTDGRRFRILTVIDDYTCENLALVRTHRCQAYAHRGSWARLLPNVACQPQLFRTTAPNLPACNPAMGPEQRDRLALHRPRQTPAERLYRKL